MTPNLKKVFKETAAPKLKEQFGIKNPMALPRLKKIVISVGMGKSLEGTKINAKMKDTVLEDLTVITGQKPVMTRAKKSVSNFKVREGYETGAMVTLRGERMWEFLDRLIALAIPRIKDFRGLNPESFDHKGNYNLGVTEQAIFPEIDTSKLDLTHGMNITFVIDNSDKEKSKAMLAELGMPFAASAAELKRN